MVKANMEGAIKTIVSVFVKSSKGKEDLGGKDFQSLVKNQLKNIMSDTDSTEAIKRMRQGLDENNDGKVSFQEYMTLIGYLAQEISLQQCPEKANNAVSPATKEEPPASSLNAEQEAAKSVEAVKEEGKAEVVEVVELVEEEENVEDVVEVS